MHYYIEVNKFGPSPGLRIIERNDDGAETVVWYLQTRHRTLILKEVLGDYLLLGDRGGKFSRFHIPSQTNTHVRQLDHDLLLGAASLTSDGLTILVTNENENNYFRPNLTRLNSDDLSTIDDVRLPFVKADEDDELDTYALSVHHHFKLVPEELWLYACNTDCDEEEPSSHEFYRLNLFNGDESVMPLPEVGNADRDLCSPALNVDLNLGVMLGWGDCLCDEQGIQPQLVLFDIQACQVIRTLPLGHFSFSQLQNLSVDTKVLLAGSDSHNEEYCAELARLYQVLTDMRWQNGKILLTLKDQQLVMDIDGHSQLFIEQNRPEREYTKEAKLAEQLEGRIPIRVNDPDNAVQKMLAYCQNIDSVRIGDMFSFALLDSSDESVESTSFLLRVVDTQFDSLCQIVTSYCDYLDTTDRKENLWEWDFSHASLSDVVYALVSTGNPKVLPLIDRYIGYVDIDHEYFIGEELIPFVCVKFDQSLPLVQKIALMVGYGEEN